MRSFLRKVIFLLLGFCMFSLAAFAQTAPSLGAVYEFNALASQKIVNEGGTVVNASVGTSDGPIEGFPPGEIKREKHEQNLYAELALAEALLAQAFLASQLPTATLNDGNLGGRTLTPGVYRVNGDASLNGKLTFNGQGQENAVFIIQVANKLQIQRAEYEMLNGAGSINIYWVVEEEVTVRRGASAIGNIFSKSNITLNEGAQLQGRLIATQGEIRLTNNVLHFPADLGVTVSKTPGSKGVNTYEFGETVTYTIRIKNNGPVNENGVMVPVQYSGNLLSYTSSKAGTSFDGNTWTAGNLNYKEEATLTITVRLNMAGSGFLMADVSGYGIDEIRSNNNANLSFCVLLSETGEVTGPSEVCVDESYVYSIAPVAGATRYTWSVPSGWSYTLLSPTSIQVKAGTNTGFIKVTASNTCGEGPARLFEVIPLSGPPAKPGLIEGPGSLCRNAETLSYSIAPVASATSYSWAVPGGWTIVTGQGTTAITVTPTGSGGQVRVQPVNPCGTGEVQALDVLIYDEAPAAPAAIRGTTQGCVGGTAAYEVSPVAGAESYSWEVPEGWAILSGQGTNRISVRVGSSAGNVSVQVENACDTSPATALPVAPVTAAPIALGPIMGALHTCAVEVGLIYSVDAVATALNYDWKLPEGWVITAGQGTRQITVNASSNGGEISVAAVNDCGTGARSAITVASTQGAPATPGPITGTSHGCMSSTNNTYSIAAVSSATSYVWTVPGGWSITAGQGGTSIQVTVGTGRGRITVKAVSACGTSPESALSVAPVATAPINVQLSEGNNDVCAGATVGFEVLNAVNIGTFVWEVPAGWEIVSGQGTPQVKVKAGSTEGIISLTAGNGCGESRVEKSVTVSTLPPDVPGAITGTQAVCGSSTQNYSIAAVSGATSYAWTVPAGWVILNGQGTTAIEVKAGTAAGDITVTAVNGCGDSNQNATLAVVPAAAVPAAIAAIYTPQGSFCQGTANLTYSINALPDASSYTWEVPAGWIITSGQGTSSIVVTAGTEGGQLSVTAANACGTGSTKTIAVAPQEMPLTPQITTGSQSPCVGVTTTYSVTASAGIDSYVWEVPADWVIVSGQGTATIQVEATSAAGKVKVTARNSCGGSGAAELEITPSEGVPAAPAAVEGPANVCIGRSIVYRVASGSGGAAYKWSVPAGWTITTGQGTEEITVVTGEGAGAVAVVAISGCGSSQETSLQVNSVPIAAPSTIFDRSTPCEGLVYEVEVEAVAGATTYTWGVPTGWTIMSGQGTPRITVTPGESTGVISVTASNGSCSSDPISIVPNNDLAKPDVSFPNVFSPNNDGNNDTWIIQNLQNYPQHELVILNRWGNEVYKSKSYKNNWNGDNLSEGTYFYVARLRMCDGSDKAFKGFVTIVR
ncbi:ice-binding family protein [Pontibacter pamirensis]|uniref:ice-binding family protein n=1 Tax=Pontibacter pamirensis TaxID=2562824 RepID=UPI001389D60F|nr:ice-binding family protein [Pontibacter pamirensis]